VAVSLCSANGLAAPPIDRDWGQPAAVVAGEPESSSANASREGAPNERANDERRVYPSTRTIRPPGEDSVVREIEVPAAADRPSQPYRASTVVTRKEIDERLPRSAPDALLYEPGVFVQQTAHSQASPFLRGMTGQQTVMLFDGIRLNNSTFRQGPNQYFFTIDARTIQRLEVVRGSSSTRYGSDALGGALLAEPIEPNLVEGKRPLTVHGRGMLRTGTADAEIGGRAQTELTYRGKVGVLFGVGYRDVGQLRSGGRIKQPATGMVQNVPPAFEADNKTQKGTGFRELAADGRLVWHPRRRFKWTLGYYDYRQFDAPRTDKCPPPEAPQDECLTYNEQFRTLVYGAFDGRDGPAGAEDTRVVVSFQNQHEDRTYEVGTPAATELEGRDDVRTFGVALAVKTKDFQLAPWARLTVRYGVDAYVDWLRSREAILFTDVDLPATALSRGQYLDRSHYLTSGLWAQIEHEFADAIQIHLGGRAALVYARAPGDPASESLAIDRTWATAVGRAGIVATPLSWLRGVVNFDQGFRAPNLDDLTSRQQTGPGFQLENPNLRPERTLTLEAGLEVLHAWVEAGVWVFQTWARDMIQRRPVSPSDCPASDPRCGASRSPLQLVNLDGRAVIRGVEAAFRLYLPWDLGLRGTVSYTWGEGPNPLAGTAADQPARRPLSRIPPLNGTVEAGWRSTRWGVHLVGALRWATTQDRLAPQDQADPRIPRGGTPGFAVFDLRAGYRFDPFVMLSIVFHNVADAPYRYHGSSINGPGRGIMAELQFGF
jgi:iron complex outermembrane receptor protein/hemoglobin/transferrin/lactoferrin receptor protein